MIDKQLKERKREFFDLVDKYYHNSSKESSGEDWLLWDWISKLVEEVENRCRKECEASKENEAIQAGAGY